MAGGLRSYFGSWWGGRLSASGTNNIVTAGGAHQTVHIFAGNIVNGAASPGGFRSRFGSWWGGRLGSVSLSPNSISGNMVQVVDVMGGSILFGNVVSGGLVQNQHILSGLLFDPRGIIDTTFLFEAE